MKKLSKISGEDIISQINSQYQIGLCAICGKCLSVCPTYREDFKEIHSPRGRLNLIASWLRGDFEPTQVFSESIMSCLLCGACTTACPREIRPAEAILIIRSHPVFDKFKTLSESFILRNLITNQKKIKHLIRLLKFYQKSGVQKIFRENIFENLPYKYQILESLLPSLPETNLLKITSEIKKPQNPVNKTALYFPGCAMNFFLPHASIATINLMTKLGLEVIIPREFFCCGAPQIHEGEIQTAIELATENLALFSKYKYDYIITDCAACGASIKNYPEWFFKDSENKKIAEKYALKTLDISELLNNLGINWENFIVSEKFRNLRLSFDNPCELRHAQKIKKSPINILKKIRGIKYIPLPESDWCCGSAGAFVVRKPQEADSIFKKKLDKLKEIEVDGILTLNPGCYFQWKAGLERYNIDIKVFYFTEILEDISFFID